MSSTGIAVTEVDFKIAENAQAHLTSLYEVVNMPNPSVVLRRGQVFTIAVKYRNGSFNPNVHRMNIVFEFKGTETTNTLHGTRGEARLNAGFRLGWKATLKDNRNNQLVIEVQSPSTAPVGEWIVLFLTASGQGQPSSYLYPGKFYLLFNPWNSADQVYMPEQRLLNEYVYNDVGKLYQKKGDEVEGQHWIYGQFDKTALLASMKALALSGLLSRYRGDPVKVSRAVTYMANSTSNPNGIVTGLWPAGEFPQPSTRPTEWTSSLQILEKYLQDGEPVKYGQCWIFAGIVTTVCRVLGLPTRAVTTVDSAHDGDQDLAISKFYDENNDKIMHETYSSGKDLQWSFHVWNETWMARPDLPRGYGGWQAIDGTPQEMSEGKFQCGPAPVAAIKNGEVGMNHDVGAFIAATNADLIHWKQTNGRYGIKKVEMSKYGTSIVTKKPYTFDPNGETDKEEIVHLYKFREGTQSERMFLLNAVRQVPRARTIYNLARQTWRDALDFQAFKVPHVPLGHELIIPFKVMNKSDSDRRVQVSAKAVSMYYNGMKGHHLGIVEGAFDLRAGGEHTMFLRLSQREYVGKLVEFGFVHAYGVASIVDTNQMWIGEVETGFRVPKITFQLPENVRRDQNNLLRLNFRNPMNVALTRCRFLFYAGSGVNVVRELPYRNVNPQEDVSVEVAFKPVRVGTHTLTATFICSETVNISGRVYIQA